jgi:hypothetical protein
MSRRSFTQDAGAGREVTGRSIRLQRARWALLMGLLLVCSRLGGCGRLRAQPDAGASDGSALADASRGDTDAAPPAEDGGSVESGAPGGSVSRAFTCGDAFGQRVCEAKLDPAALAPGIEQVPSMGVNGLHYVCRPERASAFNGRLLVHLVGTGSDPARDHRFVELGCAMGFAGIAPMYENVHDARSVCGDAGACYEGFRREIVEGGDHAPTVSVDAANSVLSRLRSALDVLASGDGDFPAWGPLRDAVGARAWSSVAVSGHSQGSGHALYLAREFSVERVIMLSGVNDRVASGTPANAPAPWVAQFGTGARTPVTRALGFVHAGDSIAVYPQLIDNWNLLGLGPSCNWTSAGGYEPSCRRVIITNPMCSGFLAHASTILAQFGPACALGGSAYTNPATWRFLLDVPVR